MRTAILGLVLCVLVSAVTAQEVSTRTKEVLGDDLIGIVRESGPVHVFAVDGVTQRDAAHLAGHPVRKLVRLEAGSTGDRRIRAAFLDSASYEGEPADCFLPDRAIRFRSGGAVATLLVSAECRSMRWLEGARTIPFAEKGPLATTLEAILSARTDGAAEAAGGDFDALLEKYRLLESLARERDEAQSTRLRELEAQVRTLRERQARLSTEGARTAEDLERSGAGAEQAMARAAELETRTKELQWELDKATERATAARQALDEARQESQRYRATMTEIRERMESMEEDRRAAAAETARLRAELEAYRERLGESRREPGESPRDTPAIDARVLSVDLQDGIVTIDRGRIHGLREGTPLVVYREDGFVGRIVIREVLDEKATGTIDRDLTRQAIQEGDLATTRIR